MSCCFQRHGKVRANASKISCACSVTFSPMLSVLLRIIFVSELRRVRACQ